MHNAADYDALTDLFMADQPRAVPAAQSQASENELPQIPPLRTPRLRIAEAMAESEDQSQPKQVIDAGQSTQVEGLILGHLPVLGAAWVTQYAKFVAEGTVANVALLRAHEGQAWLDIVQPKHAASIDASDEDSGEPLLLASAERAGTLATRWIIRVDDCNEPDLLSLAQLDTITLLTGADDPAILASYRTIKHLAQLAESMGRPLSKEPGDDGLRMRIVIMGADAARANEADVKIRRSALAFLGHALAPALSIPKISPCGTVALYRGAATATVGEVLQAAHITKAPAVNGDDAAAKQQGKQQANKKAGGPTASPFVSSAAVKQSPSTPVPDRIRTLEAPASLPPISFVPAASLAASKFAAAIETKPATQADIQLAPREPIALSEPQPVTEAIQPTTPPAIVTRPSREAIDVGLPELPSVKSTRATHFDTRVIASAPVPTVASVIRSDGGSVGSPAVQVSGTKDKETPIDRDVIALLAASDVPSLRSVAIACPYAQSVSFGVDASGTLHIAAIVASQNKSQPALQPQSTDEASAMAALQIAALWASEHHALLDAALRNAMHAVPLQRASVQHVLTPNNTALRSLMHAPVRVHMLVRAGSFVAVRIL